MRCAALFLFILTLSLCLSFFLSLSFYRVILLLLVFFSSSQCLCRLTRLVLVHFLFWLTDGAPLHSLRGHTGRVLCAVWSPRDADQLFSGATDHTVRWWAIHEHVTHTQPPAKKPKKKKSKKDKSTDVQDNGDAAADASAAPAAQAAAPAAPAPSLKKKTARRNENNCEQMRRNEKK